MQGEEQPLEIVERLNWSRAFANWRKKKSREWKPKIFYKPILFGLTQGAIQTISLISAASFRETSQVLSKAAIRRRSDFLIGLKENLILGTHLPIGTNARFITWDLLEKKNKFYTKLQAKFASTKKNQDSRAFFFATGLVVGFGAATDWVAVGDTPTGS